jgi:hypothetical protein
MSHEPYEHWILQDEDLTQEQEQAMKAHLNDCPNCQRIDQTWKDVRQQMRSLPMATPPLGFSQRWRSSLAERRILEEKLQIRRFLVLLCSVIGIVLLILLGLVLATSSPIGWFISGIQSMFSLAFQITNTTKNILSWLYILPASIPIVVWVVLTSSLSILSLVWIYFMWRISKKGVPNL